MFNPLKLAIAALGSNSALGLIGGALLVQLPALPSFVPDAINNRYEDVKSHGWVLIAKEIRKTGNVNASNMFAWAYVASNSRFSPGKARGEHLRSWARWHGVDTEGSDRQVRKRIIDLMTNPSPRRDEG
jgi:hypothetical protein